MKQNRRKFLASATGVAAASATVLSTEMSKPAIKKHNYFVHHVFFYLKTNNEKNRAELIEGLRKLTQIKEMKQYNIGVPAKSDRDVVVQDYSLSWLTYFKDAEGEKKYQVDPIHLKFVEDYKHLWTKVTVYDTNSVIF